MPHAITVARLANELRGAVTPQIIDGRRPSASFRRALAIFVGASAIAGLANTQAFATERAFTSLKSAQITAAVRGRYVSDEHHWSHHYLEDGRAVFLEGDRDRAGRWSVVRNQLCLLKPHISKTEPLCFDVQRKGAELRYTVGATVVYDGFLRGPANSGLLSELKRP